MDRIQSITPEDAIKILEEIKDSGYLGFTAKVDTRTQQDGTVANILEMTIAYTPKGKAADDVRRGFRRGRDAQDKEIRKIQDARRKEAEAIAKKREEEMRAPKIDEKALIKSVMEYSKLSEEEAKKRVEAWDDKTRAMMKDRLENEIAHKKFNDALEELNALKGAK